MIHKFRAYDVEAEYMFYSDKPEDDYSFEFIDGELTGIALRPPESLSIDSPPEPWSESYPVEQFTGKLDKNDKEIYKGSKLKMTVQDGEGIEEFKNFTYGVVVWSEHALEWGVDFGDTTYPEPLADYEEIEVIGTIHDKEKV